MLRLISVFCFLLAALVFDTSQLGAQENDRLEKAVDAYIDARFEAEPDATAQMLKLLAKGGIVGPEDVEAAIRKPRASYPDTSDLIGKTSKHDVECYHVDYSTNFLMFVPEKLLQDKPVPLVVVGHGGNSSMSPQRAEQTAEMYLKIYAPIVSKEMGAIVVAPSSTRGWGQIGNSLIASTISKVSRMFPIDPDRIYLTGQSMGGHLSYRNALSQPDRWAAVSPQSGGYDFVEKKSIGNIINVPGYVTWGAREPYGINKDNRTNQKWGVDHNVDWVYVEKNGGHTIYRDELPKMSKFFLEHPRNLYRDKVYLRSGGNMLFEKTWGIKGWPEHKVYHETRPFRWNLRHWIEVEPRPDLKMPLEYLARNKGNNQIEITSNHVRKMRVMLHPKLIDFSKPVTINVNGKQLFSGMVKPDLELMLESVREFDDRGRIYWAAVDLEIGDDQEVSLD